MLIEKDVVRSFTGIEEGATAPEVADMTKLYQVLTPEGELAEDISGRITPDLMIDMYKKMVLVRTFDRKCIILQRQGRLGTYAPFEGQEAAQVGSAMALRAGDWMFPTYRDHAAAIVHGHSLVRVFLYWMGHSDASVCPEDKRILPQCVPIATQMLHAMGAAWASKLKGEQTVSIAYLGDGATSEGDFHEALNFAGVFRAPVLFFCQNNGYAISVPFSRQSASRTIAQRAAAYDIHGVRVDGNDVFAVWLTVQDAVQRARVGGGPALIEAVTFRYGAHTTADDPKKYRDQEVLAQEWRRRDPVDRLRRFLEKQGLWNDEQEAAWQRQVGETIESALAEAEAFPKPQPADMFAHVYAEMPWHIREQQQELQRVLNEGGMQA